MNEKSLQIFQSYVDDLVTPYDPDAARSRQDSHDALEFFYLRKGQQGLGHTQLNIIPLRFPRSSENMNTISKNLSFLFRDCGILKSNEKLDIETEAPPSPLLVIHDLISFFTSKQQGL